MVRINTRELGGHRPTLNRGAAICHDPENNIVYYYGGVPWADSGDEDDNFKNTTRKASAHLFMLDVRQKRWTHLTPEGETYHEPLFDFPFVPRTDESDESYESYRPFVKPQALPELSDPMAAFYRDKETRKSYIIVFGGRKGRESDKGITQEPIGSEQFICIDVSLQVDPFAKRTACVYWRYIELCGWNTVRHRYGGTATIVEDSEAIYFCIFGGYSIPKGKNGGCPSVTYAVADLKAYSWVISDYLMPAEMKPLGYRPHAIRLRDIPGKENTLLLYGWESCESGFSATLSSCLYDPTKNAKESYSFLSFASLNAQALPPMRSSYLSNFLMLQDRSSDAQSTIMNATLVGWQLEKLGDIRQHKTHGLSLLNLKASIDDSAGVTIPFDSPTDEDDEVASITSSEATAVDPRDIPKKPTDPDEKEPRIWFDWSETVLDEDNSTTFEALGTDFTADFAVTDSDMHGVYVRIFGYKRSHSWSPAITVNTMVEIFIGTNELMESFEASDDNSNIDSPPSVSEFDDDDDERGSSPSSINLRNLNFDYLASMTIADSDDVPLDYTDFDPNTHDPLQHDLVDALLNG